MFKPLAVLAFAGAASYADAAPADLAGVWSGTLGKASITACFNASPDSNGSYYYTRFLTPIQLSREQAGEPWVEEGNSGSWQLNTPQENRLTGTWTKPSGGEPLPLVLTRTDAQGCGSDAYNRPMESAPLPAKVEKRTFGAHRYQVKTQGAEVTLKLEGDGRAMQKINQHLAQLAVSPEGQAEFFRERREYLGRNGSAHTSEIEVEPTYWSSHWITVKFYRWTAGYGRSGISWGLHSWNLQTGERVDPWRWVGSRQAWDDPYSAQVKLSPAFSAWLQKQASVDEGCPAISSYSRFDLSFNTQGLQLSTPSYGDGCDNELSFTWAQLEPVLSAQGKAALASLKTP
ncbi:hypothetical protein [Pseudomonas mucidolens]|uniref:hypothetical protein n=1 Tax=Pseudomonas mucidolens TaxID=46679 RepID=UPI0030D9E98B